MSSEMLTRSWPPHATQDSPGVTPSRCPAEVPRSVERASAVC